jgi:hypothetical protein
MGEAAGRAGFPVETLARIGGAQKGFRRTLERDATPEAGILGEVDLAHAPAAQSLDDGVRADALTDHSLQPPWRQGEHTLI